MQDADVCTYEQSGLQKEFVTLIVLTACQAQCLLGSYKGLTQNDPVQQGDLGEGQEKGNRLETHKINWAFL